MEKEKSKNAKKPVWTKGRYVFTVMLLIVAGFAWSLLFGLLSLWQGDPVPTTTYRLGETGILLIGVGVGLAWARAVKVEGVDR